MCSKYHWCFQGSRAFMQNCVTNSFTPLSFLDGDEMNNQHCMSHALNRPRSITTDAAAISKTTSVICAHSPVFLTGNVLMLSPDCWPSEGRCAFIVTESKWIPRKFTCCRGWRLCCSSSLQWNQGIEYGPVLSLCPLLLDLEWGCRSTNRLDIEELDTLKLKGG